MAIFQTNCVFKTRWLIQLLKGHVDYCVKIIGGEMDGSMRLIRKL